MKIYFERTGGLMGQHLRAEIDADRLDPAARRELEEQVETAQFFTAALPPAPPPSGADRFHYRVEIEAGSRRRAIAGGENDFPESFRPLLRYLEVLARRS